MRARTSASVPIFSAALILAACGAPQAQEAPRGSPLPEVEIAVPISANLTDWNGYSGRFESVERVDVRARVSGYVKAVHFEDGARVKSGELLFSLDDRPFRAALARNEAQLSQAKAELVQARSDLERSETLRASGAVSLEELEQNRTRAASAEAIVAATE
ncbi:efflux RND transporter periplasmic adaptor subunit [Hyphomonas sp.]|uniref:efflux RND transporter periplasmic adaptor subunit n=1 Tax=Hyphomonas sp. TaxID=87 RepID=UPI0039199FB4